MGNDSNPKRLTSAGGAGTPWTTTIGSCFLHGININLTLAGTLVVNENGTPVASFAIGTLPGAYHAIPSGVRYSALTFVLTAADDVTIFTRAV